MDLILFGDVFHDIINYLPPISIYHLKLVCRRYCIIFNKSMEYYLTKEIKTQIANIFSGEFIKTILESNTIITKKFITSCMLGNGPDCLIIYTLNDKICLSKLLRSLGMTYIENYSYLYLRCYQFTIKNVVVQIIWTGSVNVMSAVKRIKLWNNVKTINPVNMYICKDILKID